MGIEDETPEKDEPLEVVIRGKKYVQKPDEPAKKGIDITTAAFLILVLFIVGLVIARLMGWY